MMISPITAHMLLLAFFKPALSFGVGGFTKTIQKLDKQGDVIVVVGIASRNEKLNVRVRILVLFVMHIDF